MFLSVGKWNVGSGNTSLWYAESYLNFRSTWGYNGYFTVQSFLWSDEDLSLDLSKFNSITNSINSATDSINSAIDGMTSAITGEQQATNDKLDEIKDMDISEEDKELPDDSSYQDYNEAEGDLIDKVNSADMDSLDIAIDTDTSNFIWDTITDLFNSHPMIMSTIIAILSIGVIKLALGR